MKRELLIQIANEQNAKYPQYRGHFDNYVLVRVKRRVKTKLGVAFEKNDIAIADPEVRENGFRIVYSNMNGVDTSVNERDIEVLNS